MVPMLLVAILSVVFGDRVATATEIKIEPVGACSELYGGLLPDKFPEALLPAPTRGGLPARTNVGLDGRIVQNLSDVLFPDRNFIRPVLDEAYDHPIPLQQYQPEIDAKSYFHRRIKQISKEIDVNTTDPRKIKKFAHRYNISTDQATAALATVREVLSNPTEAANIFERLQQRVSSSYPEYQQMLVKQENLLRWIQYEHFANRDNGAVVLSVLFTFFGLPGAGYGEIGLLLGITPGVVGFLTTTGLWSRFWYYVRQSSLFSDAKVMSMAKNMFKNDLKRGIFNQELDRELELIWERWVKESHPVAATPELVASENSKRLLSVSEMLSYFHKIDLPNGITFADAFFNDSAHIPPHVLEDLNAMIIRKNAQLDKLGEELHYVAENSVRSTQGSVEAARQLQEIQKSGGYNPINTDIATRKLNELPTTMQIHVTNARFAQELEKTVFQLKTELENIGILINAAYDGEKSFSLAEKSGALKKLGESIKKFNLKFFGG